MPVQPAGLEPFRQVLDAKQYQDLVRAGTSTRAVLDGKTVWNVNSTARGGGVAELLESLVPYARGVGIDARWTVIRGEPELFQITKRIHNQIQGFPGDGGPLGEAEKAAYERLLEPPSAELAARVRPGDVVILHDPQTAGMAPGLKRAGVVVIWRCHIGVDSPIDLAARAWHFLAPFLTSADAYVFSRAAYAWARLDAAKVNVIAPSIDPFAPKNNPMAPSRAGAILVAAGIVNGHAAGTPSYERPNGTVGVVSDRAEMLELEPLEPDDRFVLQVSRWDRLKDPVGVMHGFTSHVPADAGANLVLAGPHPRAVDDDPEGTAIYDETAAAWRRLPEAARRRVHLASLPMRDLEQNAAIVSALQRSAEVVVQKSLAEGFGLTVAEAMWKARPVVASRIGGIQDQIEDGVSGVLLDDPTDLAAMGRAVTRLLAEPATARAIGAAARERVRRHFLNNRQLQQDAELLSRLVG